MELSNVIAANLSIIIQRMASYSFSFDFYESEDGEPLDPNSFVDVKMNVKNAAGVTKLEYSIGSGFEIANEISTGRPLLVLDKAYTEANLSPGVYKYDMLVIRNETDASIPLKGPLIYVENITQ